MGNAIGPLYSSNRGGLASPSPQDLSPVGQHYPTGFGRDKHKGSETLLVGLSRPTRYFVNLFDSFNMHLLIVNFDDWPSLRMSLHHTDPSPDPQFPAVYVRTW